MLALRLPSLFFNQEDHPRWVDLLTCQEGIPFSLPSGTTLTDSATISFLGYSKPSQVGSKDYQSKSCRFKTVLYSLCPLPCMIYVINYNEIQYTQL